MVPQPDDLGGDPLDGRGCTTWTGTGASEGLTLWADLDTIVGLAAVPGTAFRVTTDPAVASGAPFDAVRSRPAAVRAAPGPGLGTEAVDVQLEDGLRARVAGSPVEVPASATGVFVRGADVVTGVVLYEGDAPAGSLCSFP